jgi:hypothetical protein
MHDCVLNQLSKQANHLTSNTSLHCQQTLKTALASLDPSLRTDTWLDS